MKEKFHTGIMTEGQLRLYEKLAQQEFINDFYLAGGTALALQIGHRRSIDFDFFTPSVLKLQRSRKNLTKSANTFVKMKREIPLTEASTGSEFPSSGINTG